MKRFLIGSIVSGVLLVAGEAEAAPVEFQGAIEADAPVLYYQLNEASGDAINYGSFGPDYDAGYFGTPTRDVSAAGGDGGVRFDGVDDYLESLTASPVLLSGNPTFTAEALFYLPPTGIAVLWAPFLHWGDSSTSATMRSVYFSFSHNDPTEIYAGFYNGGLQTIDPVERGKWHHVVWVREGSGAANVGTTVYVDGVSVALENDPDLPANNGIPDVVSTPFRVNRAQDFDRWFTGTLDELALYDRALSPEEVQVHNDALACEVGLCRDAVGGCKACGQPLSAGNAPTASDALAILQAGIGTQDCRLCVCDVDNSGSIVATDSLLTLNLAVGQPIDRNCPAG
jgi:hypothetical protein